MALGTRTLDLTDRVDEINNRLDEIEDEKEEVKADVREALSNSNADVPEELDDWDDFEEEFDDLDAEQIELTGERRKFWKTVVHWETDTDAVELREQIDDDDEYWDKITSEYAQVDNCSFEVRELTFGQLQRVSDDMMDESFEVDVQRQDVEGTPRQGFYQIELLREAIIDWPDAAPENEEHGVSKPAPAEYPIPVGDWLFERVDAINTTGDTEMGNSSLSEAMKSER